MGWGVGVVIWARGGCQDLEGCRWGTEMLRVLPTVLGDEELGGGAFGGVKAVGTRPWVENLDGVLDVAGGGGGGGGVCRRPETCAVGRGLCRALGSAQRELEAFAVAKAFAKGLP